MMKSIKGCWTCKARKIGCDKSVPSCSNCLRTGRLCRGYGMKLAWPDEDHDKRRKEDIHIQSVDNMKLAPTAPVKHFISVFVDDISPKTKKVLVPGADPAAKSGSIVPNPVRSLEYGLQVGMGSVESFLLSYYTNVISRMITTIDDSQNGFRKILLPFALSGAEGSSKSLLNAVLAVSASHRWGKQAALKYKVFAMKALSQTIQNGQASEFSSFATCMMLCICDVFDSADGSWATHLRAAKSIANTMPDFSEQTETVKFLQTWLDYHDVLSGFSSTKPQVLQEFSRNSSSDTQIIGALGCSTELLNIISCINQLRSTTASASTEMLPQPYLGFAMQLLRQLETIQQSLIIIKDPESGVCHLSRITKTAELYRLAALIYLHRVLSTPRSSMQDIVTQSLHLIDALEVCTSPWPVYIIACEVISDEDRVRVLNAIELMQKVRGIGNVDVMREMIETLWKRRDILDCGVDVELDWRTLFDMSQRMPSFI